MNEPTEQKLLRIFINEGQRWEKKPLYEAILNAALEFKMAGATVLTGKAGFGMDAHLHESSILRLFEDLPLVVEIVDSEEKIQAFLPKLDVMIDEGLVTIETVQTILYRSKTLI